MICNYLSPKQKSWTGCTRPQATSSSSRCWLCTSVLMGASISSQRMWYVLYILYLRKRFAIILLSPISTNKKKRQPSYILIIRNQQSLIRAKKTHDLQCSNFVNNQLKGTEVLPQSLTVAGACVTLIVSFVAAAVAEGSARTAFAQAFVLKEWLKNMPMGFFFAFCQSCHVIQMVVCQTSVFSMFSASGLCVSGG